MPTCDRRSVLRASLGAGVYAALEPWARAGVPLAATPRDARPTLGVCSGPERAQLARAAGAAYLEVSCAGWLVPAASEAEFAPKRAALLASSVPPRAANSFLPGSLPSTGPKTDPDALCAYAEVAFRRAAEVGIDTITFGSSASRSIPEGFPLRDAELQFAAVLARLGPLARAHGVTVSVEALQQSETNFLNRVEDAARIEAAVQHENVRLTADIFHMLREDEGAESLRAAGEWVHHVHIAEKAKRTAPGQDGDDFRPYLRALAAIEYTGRVSIECRWSDFERELPLGLATLEEQLGSL